MHQELLELLTARKGHFQLESGHHGDLWLDLDLLFRHPGKVRPFIVALAQRLSSYNGMVVCGPLIGGALIAQWVALELDAQFCYTERVVLSSHDGLYPVTYRLPQSLGNLLRDKSVIVVDDVINAGSAIRGTLAELRQVGAWPVAVGALLVLGSTAPGFLAEQGIPIERIAPLPSNLWPPAACPLCASQTPLENIP